MSRQLSENAQDWTQDSFTDALVKNAPHDDIPQNAVAGLINAHAYSTEIQPRLAAWLWSDLQPPAWCDDCGDELTGYVFSKKADIVTAEENIFSQAFVSRYIAWPADDGYYHDEIIEYLSVNQVRMSLSGDRNATSGCYIHGRINLNNWHNRLRKKVWQIGKRVYTSPVNYSRYNECICVSRKMPSNVISAWGEMDEYGMIGNSNGIFKLKFDGYINTLWRVNGPVPDILLDGRQRRKYHKKRYDYLISMARIDGAGIRDRTTAKLLQQSGTTLLNLDINPNRDYSTYWTEKPIGDNRSPDKTGCRLRCGNLSDTHKDPGYYRTIAAPGASFVFTHNDDEAEILVDMSTTGTNVQSIKEVIDSIVAAIKTRFPWIQGEYNEDGYFEFNTGEEANASIGYLKSGTSGTDISSIIKGTESDGASIDDIWARTETNKIGTCYIPTDQGRYEWHWSHFTVWRSTDISENGADPRTLSSGEELPPLKFTWNGDYRVAAAFYASKSNGIITAMIGTFEKADEGTPFKWEDGDVDTIAEYLSGQKVRVESDYYYSEGGKSLQAGAIGGGRVMRASQSGDIVTLETELNTDIFSALECDVRKTLYWSDGYEVIIRKVLSGNSVQVWGNATRNTQGITLDPVCRVITDTVTDTTLRNRMDEKHTGLLNVRFKEPMPNCNVLEVIPGFIITARRGGSLAPYCDLPANAKYTAGYHLAGRQVIDNISGFIQFIKKAPNYFLIWCNDSLWGGPTNNPDIKSLPEFGEYYSVLHADIITDKFGAVDWGGIAEVDDGTFELICQDMSVRQIVNRKYGEDLTYNNLGQDIIATDLKACWNIGATAYGRTLGHVWWRTLK